MSFQIGECVAGRFEILQQTSSQNDLIVYLAIDQSTDKQVQIYCPSSNARLKKDLLDHFVASHQKQTALWSGLHNNTPLAIYEKALQPLTSFPKVDIHEGMQLLSTLIAQFQKAPQAFPTMSPRAGICWHIMY